MNTDRTSLTDLAAFRPTRASLEGPLVGVHARRTALALAYLLGFTVLFAVNHVVVTLRLEGRHLGVLTTSGDSLTSLVIFLATAMITVGPLVYAVWNGGPVFAFSVALVPIALGELATGRYGLGLDTMIALTVGATGCVLALYASDVRHTGSVCPWRIQPPEGTRLLVVGGLTTLAGVATIRFVRTVPTHVLEWYAPFGALWIAIGTLLGVYWATWLRVVALGRSETTST